jgi:FkbM family methyltransferase
MNIKEFMFNNAPINKYGIKTPTIIEAGTSEGKDTYHFGFMFPHGKIYGIEPILALYNNAKYVTNVLKNIDITHAALATENGTAEMNVSIMDGKYWVGSSSILEPKEHLDYHQNIKFPLKENVKTITLDSFIESKKIDHVNFLWLDLQGYEPNVLIASKKSLSIIDYIYSEVNFVELYKNLIVYSEFKKFMEDNNFEVIHEDFAEKIKNKEEIVSGNVLFKNKKWT